MNIHTELNNLFHDYCNKKLIPLGKQIDNIFVVEFMQTMFPNVILTVNNPCNTVLFTYKNTVVYVITNKQRYQVRFEYI